MFLTFLFVFLSQLHVDDIPFATDILLNGKTDIVIVPFKTAKAGIARQLRVIYDLKTTKKLKDSGSIQTGQQLSATRISQHPVMTIFSDQATAARVSVVSAGTLEVSDLISLRKAAYMMCKFLQESSVEPSYLLPAVNEAEDNLLVLGAHHVKELAPGVSEMFLRELDLAADCEDPLRASAERFCIVRKYAPWLVPVCEPMSQHVAHMFS